MEKITVTSASASPSDDALTVTSATASPGGHALTVTSASASPSDDALTTASSLGSETAENVDPPQHTITVTADVINVETVEPVAESSDAPSAAETPDNVERDVERTDVVFSRDETPENVERDGEHPSDVPDPLSATVESGDSGNVERGTDPADVPESSQNPSANTQDAQNPPANTQDAQNPPANTQDAQNQESTPENDQNPESEGQGSSEVEYVPHPAELRLLEGLGTIAAVTLYGDVNEHNTSTGNPSTSDAVEIDEPNLDVIEGETGAEAGAEADAEAGAAAVAEAGTEAVHTGSTTDSSTDLSSPDRRRSKAWRRRWSTPFTLAAKPLCRAGCPRCGIHMIPVDKSDALSSVGHLSAPSNIDKYRRSDLFGGSRSSRRPNIPPLLDFTDDPMPSTSRSQSRRYESPYKTTVESIPPPRSSAGRRGVEDDPTFYPDPANRSFFRHILDRCCCGMGMKLRCFEGDSGASSYFLLDNLGTDKDSSTEKQEELQFFDDNGGYVSVVVEKNLRAIDLTQLLAVKNRVIKDYCWSIVEYWVEIGIERVLEDHEDVLSVHRLTESGAKKFVFRRFPNKYAFFSTPENYFPADMVELKTYLPDFLYAEKHPEQLEKVLTTAEELPIIFSQVNIRQESNKTFWVKTFLLLKGSKVLMSSKVQVVAKFLRAWRESSAGYRPLEGECSINQDADLEQFVKIGEGNEEGLEVLADLKDYEVYTCLNAKNQLRGPSEYGVVLRKTNEEDFANPVVLSFDKGKDRVCWVTAMRLAKYGKQLRENYKAFKNKQETISTHGSSTNINESVRSRVAMDFTGKVGRIVEDPMEAKAIAVSEGNAWKKRLRAKVESSKCDGVQLAAGEAEKSHYGHPWYHKEMSRDQAAALITAHAHHDGVFVVRGSRSNPGGNVLSVKSQEKVIHYPILMIEDPMDKVMCYTIDQGLTKFYDIVQLVEFYRLNAGPLPTRLSNHLEKLPQQPKTPGTSARPETH